MANGEVYLLITERPERIEPHEGQELCRVCSDIANGVHFGVTTCEGCKVSGHYASFCCTWVKVPPNNYLPSSIYHFISVTLLSSSKTSLIESLVQSL